MPQTLYSGARFRAVVPPLSEEVNAGFLIKAVEPDQGQVRRAENRTIRDIARAVRSHGWVNPIVARTCFPDIESLR